MIETMRRLAGTGYIYIATPYSRHPGGIEQAFRDACQCLGWFVRHRIPAFCPIAHTHPVALECGLEPLDHNLWIPADQPMIEAAAGLAVVMMPGWMDSQGIAHEIQTVQMAHRPILYLPWPLPEDQ